VWEALLARDLAESPLSRVLLALRGYGARAFRASSATLPDRLVRFGFTKLDETPGRELVFGIAGRFWRPDGDLRRISDRDAFLSFHEDGCVKAAWNLAIEERGSGCELSTETRIQCFGAAARRKFGSYWFFVRPFSGMLRSALLSGARRRAEIGESAPS
jgi:hypothetical protein